MPEQPEAIEWTLDGGAGQTLLLDDGHASGSGGCNRFFGRYELADGRLAVEPLGSTRMACGTRSHAGRVELLDALTRVASAAIKAGEFVLADDAGVELLRFTAETRGET